MPQGTRTVCSKMFCKPLVDQDLFDLLSMCMYIYMKAMGFVPKMTNRRQGRILHGSHLRKEPQAIQLSQLCWTGRRLSAVHLLRRQLVKLNANLLQHGFQFKVFVWNGCSLQGLHLDCVALGLGFLMCFILQNIWILWVDVICSLSFNRCLGRLRLRWKAHFHKEQTSDKEDATGKAARHEDQQPMYTWPFLGAWSRKTRQLKLEIQDVCTNVGTGGQILVDRSLHLLQSHGCGCPVAGKSQGWKRTTASILHKYHLFHVK
mmetsp:Transcript_9258/g.20528  ORF Transcript_9258/g.20528 Transcript_9258/m.20528 type:complete len:261 (+) Transcript_9258:1-783(+)